jgi:tetratricopeptide (TPR) repeat protein
MKKKLFNFIIICLLSAALFFFFKKRFRFYFKKRKYYKRIKNFRKVIKEQPGSIEAAGAHYTIGLIYQNNLQDYSDAVKEYKKVFDIGSELADSALYNMGICYEALNDNLNARKSYFNLLKNFSESSRCEDAQFRLDEITLKDS